MSNNVVASPVSENGKVYLGCSYDKRAMVAINLQGAKGNITDTDHVMWTTNKELHTFHHLYSIKGPSII